MRPRCNFLRRSFGLKIVRGRLLSEQVAVAPSSGDRLSAGQPPGSIGLGPAGLSEKSHARMFKLASLAANAPAAFRTAVRLQRAGVTRQSVFDRSSVLLQPRRRRDKAWQGNCSARGRRMPSDAPCHCFGCADSAADRAWASRVAEKLTSGSVARRQAPHRCAVARASPVADTVCGPGSRIARHWRGSVRASFAANWVG